MGLTRGELARATAVNAETIRFYERQGLLRPAPRSPAGHRLFPPEAVAELALIRRLRRFGFSLNEIRALLRLRASTGAAAQRVDAYLLEIESRLKELRAMIG